MSGRYHPPSAYFPAPTDEPAEHNKRDHLRLQVMAYRLLGRGHHWIAAELSQTVDLIEELVAEAVGVIERLSASERKAFAAFAYEKLNLGAQTIQRRLHDTYEMEGPDGRIVSRAGWELLKPTDHAAYVHALTQLTIAQGKICGALRMGRDEEEDRAARAALGSRFAMAGDIGGDLENDPDALNARMRNILAQAQKGADNARRVNRNGHDHGVNGNGSHA